MAKAGYCAQCGANTWVRDDGCCEQGHPPESVSGVYEAPELGQSPPSVAQPVAPAPKRKIWPWIIAGGAALLLVCGACSVAAIAMLPAAGEVADSTQAAVDQVKGQIAADYPDWETVDFKVEVISDTGGPQTEAKFGLRPPGRDFAVGIAYTRKGNGPLVTHDEVFRAGGEFNDRSASLLDYLEKTYADKGYAIGLVESDDTGRVLVGWSRQAGNGVFSFEYFNTDELAYDDAKGTWRKK